MLFLEEYQKNNQFSPSIRGEIGNAIGVNSTSLVDYYLRQLAQMGYLERNDRVSRKYLNFETAHRRIADRKKHDFIFPAGSVPLPDLGKNAASEPTRSWFRFGIFRSGKLY